MLTEGSWAGRSVGLHGAGMKGHVRMDQKTSQCYKRVRQSNNEIETEIEMIEMGHERKQLMAA